MAGSPVYIGVTAIMLEHAPQVLEADGLNDWSNEGKLRTMGMAT